MSKYTSTDDLKRYLRTGKIRVGDADSDDLTEGELSSFIDDIEEELDEIIEAEKLTLSERACRFIAIRWAITAIYRSLYPGASVNELPQAVRDWKIEADAFLDTMRKTKTSSAGAFASWDWDRD